MDFKPPALQYPIIGPFWVEAVLVVREKLTPQLDAGEGKKVRSSVSQKVGTKI
jgi:hypothetical protein